MKKFKKNLFSPTPSVVKKVTAATLCCILSGLFLIAGCKKDEKKESYPIDIPFTEYSLPETCQWTNLGYDETVIVVNSMETLQQHIIFPEGNTPEFDFSTNSLLLVSGGAERGISGISKKLQQLSDSRYQWDIEIFLDDPDYPEPWVIAITTSKPIIENAVELNVTTSAVEYPVDVPFELYYIGSHGKSLPHHANLKYDNSALVINSQEELDNFNKSDGEFYNQLIHKFNDLPEIDFSIHTLLLASGRTNYTIGPFNNKKLQQNSLNDYKWDIDGILSGGDAEDDWISAIITKKIKSNSNFNLNVTIDFYWSLPDDFSIELFWRDYSLAETSCQWTNFITDTVFVVYNNTALEQYITCKGDIYPPIYSDSKLFLTKIRTPKLTHMLSKRLFLCKEKYKLDIEITLSDIEQPDEQIIAIITEEFIALPVELNVKYY